MGSNVNSIENGFILLTKMLFLLHIFFFFLKFQIYIYAFIVIYRKIVYSNSFRLYLALQLAIIVITILE
jgi:hypothetical protein